MIAYDRPSSHSHLTPLHTLTNARSTCIRARTICKELHKLALVSGRHLEKVLLKLLLLRHLVLLNLLLRLLMMTWPTLVHCAHRRLGWSLWGPVSLTSCSCNGGLLLKVCRHKGRLLLLLLLSTRLMVMGGRVEGVLCLVSSMMVLHGLCTVQQTGLKEGTQCILVLGRSRGVKTNGRTRDVTRHTESRHSCDISARTSVYPAKGTHTGRRPSLLRLRTTTGRGSKVR